MGQPDKKWEIAPSHVAYRRGTGACFCLQAFCLINGFFFFTEALLHPNTIYFNYLKFVLLNINNCLNQVNVPIFDKLRRLSNHKYCKHFLFHRFFAFKHRGIFVSGNAHWIYIRQLQLFYLDWKFSISLENTFEIIKI